MKTQALLSLALATVAVAQSKKESLTDVLASNNKTLSMLNGLLQSEPDLAKQLSRRKNITILAPSNDALTEFLNGTNITEAAAEDPSIVSAILSYHVLNGTWYASNFTDTPAFIPTLLNNRSYENVTGGQVVEGVAVNETVSFYSALRAESNVTQANLNFTGGVIHIINKVLEIPENLTETAIAANLSAVAGALTQTNLLDQLVDTQNITVFAPSNGAFARIGSIVDDMSSDELSDILEYHVVSGTIGYSSSLMNTTLKTAEGGNVTISVYDGEIFVNEAKVILPDVLISNGVLHIINDVLNPQNPSATADPDSKTQSAAFSGATSASDVGVPFTSGVPKATEQATGLQTATSEEAGARATAGVMLGALFGGAAIAINM